MNRNEIIQNKHNLRHADLYNADLRNADLRNADLYNADLRYANLCNADLRNADLRYANLCNADLRNADLSGVKGILNPLTYLKQNFEFNEQGFIGYKTFGDQYQPNSNWKIEKGSVIKEVVNHLRTNECGCGINIGTLEWVKSQYSSPIWKVQVKYEDFCDVIIPYYTDGKIRCGKCTLVEVVKN